MRRRSDAASTPEAARKGDRPTDRIELHAAGAPPANAAGRRWGTRFLWIAAFLVLGTAFLSASLVAAIYWQARTSQGRPVDAIVVLGAAQYDGRPSDVLRGRLDATFDAWEAGYAPRIIVTGGKLEGDRFTEAEASRNYLVELGVPESSIYLENEGRSTEESLDGVATIMEELNIKRALFVSDGFHLFRIKLIARSHGIEGYAYPATDSPIRPNSANEFSYVIREAAASVAFLWTRVF